jgi:WD40 repeat protein
MELSRHFGPAGDSWSRPQYDLQSGGIPISTSYDRTLKVWDLEYGVALHTLNGHRLHVDAVAVTPDGRGAISGDESGFCKVWDLESGAELQTLEDRTPLYTSVAITPDGRRGISASQRAIQVWTLQGGKVIANFEGDSCWGACAVAPNGMTIVAGDGSGRGKAVQFNPFTINADWRPVARAWRRNGKEAGQ